LDVSSASESAGSARIALLADGVLVRQVVTKSKIGSVSVILGVGHVLGVEDLSDNNELLIGSVFLETVVVVVVTVEVEVV
jgi:hypothetical protein